MKTNLKYVKGYLIRRPMGSRYRGKITEPVYRDWWFVKYRSQSNSGVIQLGKKTIFLPKELIGKKIRIKIEVVEEKE